MKNRNKSRAAARVLAIILVASMLLAGAGYMFSALGIFF